MSRLVQYFDKRELYDAFQKEVMPLLDLLYEIYKNCDEQELYKDFEAFYQKLFCDRRKLKHLLKNKCKLYKFFKLICLFFNNILFLDMDLWSKYKC